MARKVKKLPKWAIKQAGGINKKAWALARRGRGRSRPKGKAKAKRRARPKAKGGRRMSRQKSVNIATILGVVKALLFPFGSNIDRARAGDWQGILDATMAGMTGFNSQGQFDLGWLKEGLLPVVAGAATSMIASQVGLNRVIARNTQGIPLLNRIRI